jgi:nucleoside-diphosphate-sugar epimerase
MNVLLTGAGGNIGQSTLEKLLSRGHQVRCFDVPTKANRRLLRRFRGRAEIVWGDIRRPEDLATAVDGQEVVIHLAFVIPKMSVTGVDCEDRPQWAYEINVSGTRNLLQAMRAVSAPPRILFSSSYHVYGRTQHRLPPLTVTDPVQPIEHYSYHKILCEQMVRGAGLTWSILRLSATLPLRLQLDPGMFDVPLDNRMEFTHTKDVAVAIANALECPDAWGRILLIGGGLRCQYYYREIVERSLDEMGVGMVPEELFGQTPFPTDWVDTVDSQRLLDYQRRDLGDYLADMRRVLGPRRRAVRLFRPLVRRWLMRRSPYYGRERVPKEPVPSAAGAA